MWWLYSLYPDLTTVSGRMGVVCFALVYCLLIGIGDTLACVPCDCLCRLVGASCRAGMEAAVVAEVGAASTKLVSVSLPVYARSAFRIGSERQCRALVLGLHREYGDWWEPGGSVTCLGFTKEPACVECEGRRSHADKRTLTGVMALFLVPGHHFPVFFSLNFCALCFFSTQVPDYYMPAAPAPSTDDFENEPPLLEGIWTLV